MPPPPAPIAQRAAEPPRLPAQLSRSELQRMLDAGELKRIDLARFARQGFPDSSRTRADKEIVVSWSMAPHGTNAQLFVDRFHRLWIVDGESHSLHHWPAHTHQPAIRSMHARFPIPDGHVFGGRLRLVDEPRTKRHAAIPTRRTAP